MDENSFDPRSWRKKEAKPPELAAPPGDAAGARTEIDLPEAWQGIGTALGPDPAAGRGPAPVRPNAQRFAWLASAGVLLAAALAAWVTRVPPEPGGSPAHIARQAQPGVVERSLRLAGPREIASALVTLGVPPPDAGEAAQAAAGILEAAKEIRLKVELKPGSKAPTLERMQVSYGDGSGAVVARGADGKFAASAVAVDLKNSIQFLPGEIDSDSFYSSAVAARVPDTLVPEFINAFAYDFNLASEVSPGDTFEVAYEQSVDADGAAVGQPQLVYAKLTTAAKSVALYRFVTSDGKVGWYDGNGATTKRGMMRTPVDGARITSKYGMRLHPFLKFNKMHKGVDFAAPVGTAIYAARDGVVEWAAMKGLNGNFTKIQHDGDMETLYLHQSMFMPGIVPGAHVTQGEKIGEIGTTGRSTGPHLHFEVHLHGVPVDPLSIPSEADKREILAGAEMAAFIEQRNRIDVARAQQGN